MNLIELNDHARIGRILRYQRTISIDDPMERNISTVISRGTYSTVGTFKDGTKSSAVLTNEIMPPPDQD